MEFLPAKAKRLGIVKDNLVRSGTDTEEEKMPGGDEVQDDMPTSPISQPASGPTSPTGELPPSSSFKASPGSGKLKKSATIVGKAKSFINRKEVKF